MRLMLFALNMHQQLLPCDICVSLAYLACHLAWPSVGSHSMSFKVVSTSQLIIIIYPNDFRLDLSFATCLIFRLFQSFCSCWLRAASLAQPKTICSLETLFVQHKHVNKHHHPIIMIIVKMMLMTMPIRRYAHLQLQAMQLLEPG